MKKNYKYIKKKNKKKKRRLKKKKRRSKRKKKNIKSSKTKKNKRRLKDQLRNRTTTQRKYQRKIRIKLPKTLIQTTTDEPAPLTTDSEDITELLHSASIGNLQTVRRNGL